MNQEWINSAIIVQKQMRETVEQEAAGITVRMATVTCVCGRVRAMTLLYRCLYCKVMMCEQCAEAHFGQTVEEYKAAKEPKP